MKIIKTIGVILVSLFFFSTTAFSQNLIENWDGNGDTNNATSYPNLYGWEVTTGTFNYANSTSGVRYSDVSPSSSPVHNLNGNPFTGRILMVRWDGAGSTSLTSVFSYPAILEAGKKYKLSFAYEWWNNASLPTYTVGVGTAKNGTAPVVSGDFICGAKNVLQNGELSFFVSTSGTYYLTIKANNLAVLGGITNLSLVEIPPVLGCDANSVNLNYYTSSQTINISPNGSSNSIVLNAPAGVSLSPSSLTSAGGSIVVSSADSTSVSGNIGIAQGGDVVNIPITASFPKNFIQTGKIDTLDIDGAWCWFADPRSIYHKGQKEQTYFSWVTSTGDIVIAAYNHKTGEYIKNTLSEKLQVDDHANPSVFIRKDGKIILFYSKHFDTVMRYRISTNAEDISSFGAEKTFGYNVTYPYPFQVGNDIVIFYRGDADWHPTMAVSHDNGETFDAPTKFIIGGGQRPYTRYCQDSTGAIHVAYTTGHPRNEASNKIYYALFKNDKFYRADGTLIKDYNAGANPLNIDTNDAETVYNASNGKGWIWDITVDSDKNPVMVFASFPTDTDHRYYYSRWTGANWFQKQLTNGGKWFPQTPVNTTEPEPNYSGGISLDYDNPSTVYLSKQVKDVFEIFKFTTPDKGITWDSIAVTWNTPKEYVNVRPIAPRHHKKGFFDVLWMKGPYTYYTNYHTSIVYRMDSTVNQADSIKLNSNAITIYQGNNAMLTATFFPFITKDKSLVWSSSNLAVATVNNGIIKGIAPGSSIVTATTANGKTATVQVTVLTPNYLNEAFFDFGTSTSPVVLGAIQVTESTMLSNSYGWENGSVVYSRDRGTGNSDELRDFMLASTPNTFSVFVNNADFHITVKQGDPSYAHDNMSIAVNGETKVSGVNSALGVFTTSEFDVTVSNNKLEFTFADGGGSDVNWVVNSLKITSLTNLIKDKKIADFAHQAVSMTVFDLSGKKILSEKLNEKSYTDILKAAVKSKGVYLIRFENGTDYKNVKIAL